MSETVRQPHERLDRLARRIYGTEQGGTVEALLAANPGLAEAGLNVAGGLIIKTPDVDLTPPDQTVKPWE
jgi:phage tail protein X